MRLFKAACPRGVVRAFSDQPSSFASEFNKVRQAVLVVLYMQAVVPQAVVPPLLLLLQSPLLFLLN